MEARITSKKELPCSAEIKKGLFLCLLISFSALQVRAEETPPPTYTNIPTSSRDILSGIESLAESLNFLSAIKSGKKPIDTIALQTALNGVISLSEKELENIEKQLRLLGNLKGDDETTREEYLDRISTLENRMQVIKTSANRDISVDEILAIAREVKEWRETAYAPRVRPMVDFIAVTQNTKAIITAHERLISITKDERKIRGFFAGSKAGPFLKLLKKAQGEIAQATDMNEEAKRLFALARAGDEGDGSIDTAIEGSNALVNAAYDDFSAMSKLVKK